MSARGEVITKVRLRPAIREAVEQAAVTIDRPGVRALRTLLHAGISQHVPLITASPDKHIEAYESAVRMLRARQGRWTGRVADPAATEAFLELEKEAAEFLRLCAELSGTQWLEPVESIAAYGLSLVRGAILRWLADFDDEAILVVLDDLVSTIAMKAVEL
ncbi:TetR family transcriptional regulator [Nocardia sp. 004]|uniref:TetR family transcriptional regulator n=1 Tax=Nocardia sp. 004 TaxID=3385978 RepID=UPI0039A1D295